MYTRPRRNTPRVRAAGPDRTGCDIFTRRFWDIYSRRQPSPVILQGPAGTAGAGPPPRRDLCGDSPNGPLDESVSFPFLTSVIPAGREADAPPIKFTDDARRALALAYVSAADTRSSAVYPVHVVAGVLREPHGLIARLVERLGKSPTTVLQQLLPTERRWGTAEPSAAAGLSYTEATKRVVRDAAHEVARRGADAVGPEDLLICAADELERDGNASLRAAGVGADALRKAYQDLRSAGSQGAP